MGLGQDKNCYISYYIPLIGPAEINLGDYPCLFYQFLINKGEFNRLQKLAHLGVLHEVFKGMRHTRWDYTVTMLFLIQELNESKLEGLRTEKKVIKGFKLSGRDMLQLLALSSSIGHLPGTFAIEKGVMRYFIEHHSVAGKLYKNVGLPKDFYDKIDYTNINKLFLLWKLQIWSNGSIAENTNNVLQGLKNLWQNLYFGRPGTEHREKIYNYFDLVRQISFQLLDCIYVNPLLKFDFSSFINQLSKALWEKSQIESIAELTNYYSRIVYKNIYHSPSACRVIDSWSNKVRKFLEKQDEPLDTIREWLMESDPEKIIEKPLINTKEIFSCTLPYRFGANFLIDSFVSSQIEKLEIELMKTLKDGQALILYIPNFKDPIFDTIEPGDLFFNVYAKEKSNKEEILQTLGLIVSWVYKHFKNKLGIGIIAKSITEKLLELLAPNRDINVTVELPPDDFFFSDYDIVKEDKIQILNANQRHEILNTLLKREDNNWSKPLREYFAECKVLKELAKKQFKKPQRGVGQYWVIVPGRLKFYDKAERKDICEFDGAVLYVAKKGQKINSLTVFLIESKAGRSSSKSEAVKRLREKLEKKLQTSLSFKIRKIKRKNAYAQIKMI